MTLSSMRQTEIPACRALIKGCIELTVLGSDKTISQPSHSFVANMAHAFRASCMYTIVNDKAKDINGDPVAVLVRAHYGSSGTGAARWGAAGLEVTADAGYSNNGIIVGDGTGTGFDFDPTNYCLKHQIAHLSGDGDPANKLAYGSSTMPSSTFTDDAGSIRVTRDFTNTSTTAGITITEVGLVGATKAVGQSPPEKVNYVMISRDILTEAVTILPGKTLLVSYTLTGGL